MNTTRLFGFIGMPSDPGDCWLWNGPIHKEYGRYNGRQAHRVVFEYTHRLSLPPDVELDHTCLQTLCVNPAHLDPVTRAENMRRRYADYTHCVNGHEFTAANTYRRPSTGHRQCRACQRAAVARYTLRRAGKGVLR